MIKQQSLEFITNPKCVALLIALTLVIIMIVVFDSFQQTDFRKEEAALLQDMELLSNYDSNEAFINRVGGKGAKKNTSLFLRMRAMSPFKRGKKKVT